MTPEPLTATGSVFVFIVTLWDLLGLNGHVEGRFTIDHSVYLRVLTDSVVYAIKRDELDVQYIVGYRIVASDE